MKTANTQSHIRELIEEIRADIDFELDDAVTEIVKNLPREYFSTIDRVNQLTHLKALVASRICSIDGEMFVPCDSGNQIAVIGRQNYRGQLAKILDRLPTGRTIVRANVFTSNSYDFIIDIFDLEPETKPETCKSHASIDPTLVSTLVNESNCSDKDAERFMNSFASFQPGEQTATRLPQLYEAYRLLAGSPIVVHWWPVPKNIKEVRKFTIATRHKDEKLVFRKATKILTEHEVDILHAKMGVLNRFPADSPEPQTILLTFKLAEREGDELDRLGNLSEELRVAIER